MDFAVTPEEQELVESVSVVLASEYPTALVRDVVENGRAPEQPWKSARELGWTAVELPAALGGIGLGQYLRPKLFGTELNQRAAHLATEALGAQALDVDFEGAGYDDSFGRPPWMTLYLQATGGRSRPGPRRSSATSSPSGCSGCRAADAQ